MAIFGIDQLLLPLGSVDKSHDSAIVSLTDCFFFTALYAALSIIKQSNGAESIILSAGGAETIMLSAYAESIILSGAESMILSAHADSMILSAPPAESLILLVLPADATCKHTGTECQQIVVP